MNWESAMPLVLTFLKTFPALESVAWKCYLGGWIGSLIMMIVMLQFLWWNTNLTLFNFFLHLQHYPHDLDDYHVSIKLTHTHTHTHHVSLIFLILFYSISFSRVLTVDLMINLVWQCFSIWVFHSFSCNMTEFMPQHLI